MVSFNLRNNNFCSCYDYKEKPAIESLELEPQKEETFLVKKNKLFFVLKGCLHVRYEGFEKVVEENQFFFASSGSELHSITLKTTILITITLKVNTYLTKSFRIEELYTNKLNNDSAVVNQNNDLFLLNITPPLKHFLIGLNDFILNGVNCKCYYDAKIKEMAILLRAYYSIQDLQQLFQSILSMDTEFFEYIRKNIHLYSTVNELAEANNMTPKTFSRKFTKIFGESPIRWMINEKARKIHSELRYGQKPIGQIADEYGFLAHAHFNKFCKRELGKNPTEIRAEKSIKKEP
jgi:AraC-like DNA-binding protein